MHYSGGKAKTFQHVVNLIPPHEVYIEPFLGLGSVMRAKFPSSTEIGVDLDGEVLAKSGLAERSINLVHGDGIEFLQKYDFGGREVVYCDPPYLPETRKRCRVYKHDASAADHLRLLNLLVSINARVLLSGYDSETYREHLQDWNVHVFQAKAHDGLREERIWYNFPKPAKLHDYRYMGGNYRERQTIKRRLTRLTNRIESLSDQEQAFVQDWVQRRRNNSAA